MILRYFFSSLLRPFNRIHVFVAKIVLKITIDWNPLKFYIDSVVDIRCNLTLTFDIKLTYVNIDMFNIKYYPLYMYFFFKSKQFGFDPLFNFDFNLTRN